MPSNGRVSKDAMDDAFDWADSEEEVSGARPSEVEILDHAEQYDKKHKGKIRRLSEGSGKRKTRADQWTDDDIGRMAAANAQADIKKAQNEGRTVNATLAKKAESKWKTNLLNERDQTAKKREKTYGPKPVDYDSIPEFKDSGRSILSMRRRNPGTGRTRPERIDYSVIESNKRKTGIVDDRSTFLSKDVYYNPKENKYYVPGYSAQKPKNDSEYFKLDGSNAYENKLAIKGRGIESKRYNSINKAKNTREKGAKKEKRKRFWQSQADFDAGKQRIDSTMGSMEKKKKSTISWLGRQGDMKAAGERVGKTGRWFKKRGGNVIARDAKRRHFYKPSDGISGTAMRGSQKLQSFGYALPGPFQVFTLAWRKTTGALKITLLLAFAFFIFFLPWGLFYFTGWAMGAAVMFLISLLYWVFISFFNAIAFILVSLINAVASIVMGVIIMVVEWFFYMLKISPTWENGRMLLSNVLIDYDQIANVPSLYKIVSPEWTSWMNDSLIGHLFKLFNLDVNLAWLAKPFSDFYDGLATETAMVLGVVIIAIPIGLLVYIYYRNRHLIHNY